MKKFRIYQIREDAPDSRYIKFSSLEMLEHLGLRDKLTFDMYDKVYEGYVEEKEGEIGVILLDHIYTEFQGTKPACFKGHSLSVSDIVEVDCRYFYCDSFGWEEVKFSKNTIEFSPEDVPQEEVA